MLETWQDIRLAARSLRRTPVFTVTVVVTLALGIGANTAIFSLMDAIMLRPLPVRDPGELWQLYDEGPAAPGDTQGGSAKSEILPWPLVERFQRALPSGASVAAMTAPTRLNARLAMDPATTLVQSQLVSGGFFSTFGVRPALGRLLTDDDMRMIDGHPVAVIGYGFWQRQFGGSPSVLGRTLPINGIAFAVVGVAEPDFRGVWMDSIVDIWVPLIMQHAIGYRQNASTNNANDDQPWPAQIRVSWLDVVVRSPADQRDSIEGTFSRLHREAMQEVVGDHTDTGTRQLLLRQLKMESFARGYSNVRFQYSSALLLLMTLVTLLLLVACANVASLLLAQWGARQREVAIRLSIGAGRWRLVRQLLTESLLLAVIGGAAGLLIAEWASTTLATSAQVRSLLPASIALNSRVLAFCALTSMMTVLIFGVVPAVRATGAAPVNALRTGGTRAGHATSVMRPLVSAQVALSVVLVVAAVLFARSLLSLWYLDPGYDREHLIQIRMDPRAGGLKHEDLLAVYQKITERARQVPGVLAAEVSRVGLASGRRSVGSLTVEGYQPAPGEVVRFMFNNVGPTYFATTGMTLVQGRAFNERDIDGRPRVAVVNELAARRYFGGVDKAIGKRIGFGTLDIEVVGVVRDARVIALREAPTPMAFAPILQVPGYAQALDVRVAGAPVHVAEAVRRAVADTEPRLLADSRPTVVGESLDRGLARDRVVAGLAIAFGALALLLACIGLYGVLTYAVAQRTSEMGVRMALGATASDVLRLVLGDGLRVTVAGITVGAIGAFAAGRLIRSLLFGVTPSDPVTFAAVLTALLVVASLASLLPARRAARVDPMTALRAE